MGVQIARTISKKNFPHVGPFLTLLGHFGPFLTLLGRFGPFWTILDRVGPCWTFWDHFELFWAILDKEYHIYLQCIVYFSYKHKIKLRKIFIKKNIGPFKQSYVAQTSRSFSSLSLWNLFGVI